MTFSTGLNVVESEVLINLESVERNYLKLRKSGVDEALRLVDTVQSLDPKLVKLHKSLTTDPTRTSEEIHVYY